MKCFVHVSYILSTLLLGFQTTHFEIDQVMFLSRKRFRVNPVTSSKEFLDIHATIECGFTLKRVRDMTRTYGQMHLTDKYSTRLNHLAGLAEWLSVCFLTKWLWVRVQLQSIITCVSFL